MRFIAVERANLSRERDAKLRDSESLPGRRNSDEGMAIFPAARVNGGEREIGVQCGESRYRYSSCK
jgi:hypothetical protein